MGPHPWSLNYFPLLVIAIKMFGFFFFFFLLLFSFLGKSHKIAKKRASLPGWFGEAAHTAFRLSFCFPLRLSLPTDRVHPEERAERGWIWGRIGAAPPRQPPGQAQCPCRSVPRRMPAQVGCSGGTTDTGVAPHGHNGIVPPTRVFPTALAHFSVLIFKTLCPFSKIF